MYLDCIKNVREYGRDNQEWSIYRYRQHRTKRNEINPLKSEFSEENVEFWITCEEFCCSGDANMQVFAQKIYGDFVIFNGPKEV
jgi:hypothetical protein